ncbi:uncharacterized protein LOC130978505 [Arachis stenosperma]|uniref:uncharacterized protein LOC130978505 n=1 Tax=Arachis stenosperma TaxID=217475 RepID=UPI0025AC7FBE|nr:uncharacterized protein LOC130978505 [Arachis stenosperma]
MTHFTTAAMEIPDLNPEVQLHAIKSGLRPGKFQEAIAVVRQKTLEEFREKAMGQIKIEELHETRRNERPASRKEEERPYRSQSRDSKKPFRLAPKFDSYTKFNTKREDIIKEIIHSKLIKPPSRADTYQDQRYIDKTKHCAFHQKFGHTTDECVVAKDMLERLARQGLLDKYIGRQIHKEQPASGEAEHTKASGEKSQWQNNQLPKKVINYISGGFACGGETSSARKRSYRTMLAVQNETLFDLPTPKVPDITFTSRDFDTKTPNLNDPVVILVTTGDLLIRKVLLYQGSSADVMFLSTFKKMQLNKKVLQPSSGKLVGFLGERVPVTGYVWVKTTLGEPPHSKTLDIQYLIVDCFSPYNIILGRPSLNTFRAMVSTIHLCVKFCSEKGTIAIIYSDRKEARQCYNAGLKVQQATMRRINSVYNASDIPDLAELDPRIHHEQRPTPADDL